MTVHEANAARASALQKAADAEGAAKLAVSQAKSLADSVGLLVAAVVATTARADAAEEQTVGERRELGILARDTLLLAREVGQLGDRNVTLTADLARYKALVDHPPAPSITGKLLGFIPVKCVAGAGVTTGVGITSSAGLRTGATAAVGLAITCGIPLGGQ